MIPKSRNRFSDRIMVEQQNRIPCRLFRQGSGSVSALVFATGAVALWSTNALVGKSLLASHPVSQVQFLQFVGAALVFAAIRLMSREKATAITASTALVPLAVGFIGLV